MGRIWTRLGAAVGFSWIVVGAAACGGSKPEPKAPVAESGDGASGPATVGKPAPDLSIQTINGKGKISLKELKGKVAIVDFWATWCGPCKQSFPKFEELAKKHAGQVEIVGISVDDEQNGVADWAKQQGATFAIGWDEGHALANRWKVETMPTTYLLDANGQVRYIHAGFHDDEPDQIAKELKTLLAESPGSGSSSASASASDKPKDAAADKDKDNKDNKDTASASAAAPASSDDAASDSGDAAQAPATPAKKAGKGKGKKATKKSAKKKK